MRDLLFQFLDDVNSAGTLFEVLMFILLLEIANRQTHKTITVTNPQHHLCGQGLLIYCL